MKKFTMLALIGLFLVAWIGTDSLAPLNRPEVKYLKFEEVLRLGENPDQDEELFTHVGQPFVDSDQQLYLRDFGENRIQVFDNNFQIAFAVLLNTSGCLSAPGCIDFPAGIGNFIFRQIFRIDTRPQIQSDESSKLDNLHTLLPFLQ